MGRVLLVGPAARKLIRRLDFSQDDCSIPDQWRDHRVPPAVKHTHQPFEIFCFYDIHSLSGVRNEDGSDGLTDNDWQNLCQLPGEQLAGNRSD